MAERITTINHPESPIHAVFIGSDQNLVRKRVILAGFNDPEAPKNNTVVPMVWRDDRQAFYRVDDFSSFLGLEQDGKKDWSHVVDGAQRMQETAREFTEQLERDMQREEQPEVHRGAPGSNPQPRREQQRQRQRQPQQPQQSQSQSQPSRREQRRQEQTASQKDREYAFDMGDESAPSSVGGPSEEYQRSQERASMKDRSERERARKEPAARRESTDSDDDSGSGWDKFKPWN